MLVVQEMELSLNPGKTEPQVLLLAVLTAVAVAVVDRKRNLEAAAIMVVRAVAAEQ